MNTNYTQLNTNRFDDKTSLKPGNLVTEVSSSIKSNLSNLTSLKPGQVFTGQIMDIRNDYVSLNFDQQTIQAKFEGYVDLCIGDILQLVVKENNNNRLILSPYQQQPMSVEDHALYKALDAAELPTSDKNIDLVGLLLKNNMPIDKQSIHSFISYSLKFPNVPLETLVTMSKYNIDIPSDNIVQFEHYKNSQHQLTNDIKQLSEMLPRTIESVFEHMGPAQTSQFLSGFMDESSDNPVLQQVLKLLNDPESTEVVLKNLLRGKEFQNALQQEVLNQWSFKPDHLNSAEIEIKYNKIENQLQFFAEQLINQSNKFEGVTQSAKNMQDNINFMKNLNDNFIYTQLPMQLSNQVTHSELYVYTKRKSSANKKDGIHLLLNLDMEHLGQTSISIKMQDMNLNLNFSVSNQEVEELLEQHLDKLNTSLSNKGFSVHSKVESKENEEHIDFVEDFLAQGENKLGVKHYSFDMRV